MKFLNIFRGADARLLDFYEWVGRLLADRRTRFSIPETALLIRQFWSPHMGVNILEPQEKLVFEFQEKDGERCESLVWTRFAPKPECIHSISRIMQDRHLNASKRQYGGYFPTTVDRILACRNSKGHGFRVIHDPSEGIQHVHIYFDKSPDHSLDKNDRNGLKLALMQEVFTNHVSV